MRSAPIPARVFTTCPTCGDLISAAIAPEDRQCPRDRGTVSIDSIAEPTEVVQPLSKLDQFMRDYVPRDSFAAAREAHRA